MSERLFLIEPRDPAIFRDGKPFAAGLSAKTLPFATPSAVIGAIRTRLGSASGRFNSELVPQLLELGQTGPFLVYKRQGDAKWKVCLPAPADAVLYGKGCDKDPFVVRPLRPRNESSLCDLPKGLNPLFGATEEKAGKGPSFWDWMTAEAWLAHGDSQAWTKRFEELGPPHLETQKRIHVNINPSVQTAEEGMLFSTESIEFERKERSEWVRFALLTRVIGDMPGKIAPVSHIGGEGRTAFWTEPVLTDVDWPVQPKAAGAGRKDGKRLIRLQLVTPGYFKEGWRPGWTTDGKAKHLEGIQVKLLAAAVPRAMPMSGWDLRAGGPKATRFLAPAGSVYFCEAEGDASSLWLKSICDDEQDRRDGFGLVVCGEWEWNKD